MGFYCGARWVGLLRRAGVCNRGSVVYVFRRTVRTETWPTVCLRSYRIPKPLTLITLFFIFASCVRGTVIVTAVAVLPLYIYVRLWYKKERGRARRLGPVVLVGAGSWWFPQISIQRQEFYFFLQPERSSS